MSGYKSVLKVLKDPKTYLTGLLIASVINYSTGDGPFGSAYAKDKKPKTKLEENKKKFKEKERNFFDYKKGKGKNLNKGKKKEKSRLEKAKEYVENDLKKK